ncbi:MAG: peptidase S41 [Phycisphaerales bacterium]|nr:peptidase S41 [Phycisphaerales bacterium]
MRNPVNHVLLPLASPALAALALYVLASGSAAAPQARDAQAIPDASMLRYPDISGDRIVFVYANGIWSVPISGGIAQPVADPPGFESFPRFSPDGASVAFCGNWDGNRDIWTVPVTGGEPSRVTGHPASETLNDWSPDGRLLFTASGMGPYPRATMVYSVAPAGGLPVELPVPYGANATLSRDGTKLAYTPHSTDTRTWKRYRGGMATDVWVVDMATGAATRVTDWEGTDTIPMWHGEWLYYLSDAGPEHRLNIWRVNPTTKAREQVTRFADFDVRWPAIGPDDGSPGRMVFQHGPELCVLDLGTGKASPVEVRIPGARARLRDLSEDAADSIQSWDISPTGKRAVVQGRGDVWTLPAENGVPANLTRTTAIAEREPAWSPDGRLIAWFDDSYGGGYELFVASADGSGEKRRLTSSDGCFKESITWSPDSTMIAMTDKTGRLWKVDVASGAATLVDKESWGESIAAPSWSSDSTWLAYVRSDDATAQSRLWLHDLEAGASVPLTSTAFDVGSATFDRAGDFIYLHRVGNFRASYSSLDSTWIYDNASVMLAAPLRADVKAPWIEVEIDEEKPAAKKGDGTPQGEKPKDDNPEAGKKENEKEGDGEEEDSEEEDGKDEYEKPEPAQDVARVTGGAAAEPTQDDDGAAAPAVPAQKSARTVKIDVDGFESRMVPVPGIAPGEFGAVAVSDKGSLVFARRAARGREEPNAGIRIADVKERKPSEKSVTGGGGFAMSADGKKLLVAEGRGAKIGDASAGATFKPVVASPTSVMVSPRAEWRQLVRDAWRVLKDYFYDPTMHGIDWDAVRNRYAAMVDDANSREDVAWIISEMISELNVGHAYYQGGPSESAPSVGTGMLGVVWAQGEAPGPDGTAVKGWRIERILEGGPWDTDARNPLRAPGVDVREGMYVIAVNGQPIGSSPDPWSPFRGLADKAVQLTVGNSPLRDDSTRTVNVRTLASEDDLRYRAWVEANRAYVAKASDGKVGYVYVPNTGVDGQSELVRQFHGQRGMKALLIDERWNGGGQIPSRFIEMLNRPTTNWWARRDSNPVPSPQDSHRGPKAMLINGLAGSGGDMFPWLFRETKLGPLFGTRTWGGLVGISGNPSLIDGTRITAPMFAFYENDGTWGVEGHGVDPDIEVIDDPALMRGGPVRGGTDPQIDAAVKHLLAELERNPVRDVPVPPYPQRDGMGIPKSDW